MIQYVKAAEIRTLGESRKHSDEYTNYDYIEFSSNNELLQIRDVSVHDSVNAGLNVGGKADFVLGTYNIYSYFSFSENVTELLSMISEEGQRTSYDSLLEQLSNRPTCIKILPWILTMPVRAFISCLKNVGGGALGALIGTLSVTYFSIFLAPLVAPVTFFRRRKKYSELVHSVRIFIEQVKGSNTGSHAYGVLEKSIQDV